MSKIDDLISPKVEVTFIGEKYMLESGFTIEESPAIQMAFGNREPEVRARGMGLLLKVVARRLFPEASEDKISKIDSRHIDDLLKVYFQLDKSTKSDKEEVKKVLDNSKTEDHK